MPIHKKSAFVLPIRRSGHVCLLRILFLSRSLSGIGSLEPRINNLRAIPGL